MARVTRPAIILLLALAAAGAAGCTFVPEKKPPAPPDPSLDPCPSRLHDIAGSLLLYYVSHEDLPPDTAAIKQAGGQACPPLECPLSHRPYIYNPQGVQLQAVVGLVVMYDDAPVHDGRRWGLIVSQISPAAPLKVDVIRLPAGFNPSPPAPSVAPTPLVNPAR